MAIVSIAFLVCVDGVRASQSSSHARQESPEASGAASNARSFMELFTDLEQSFDRAATNNDQNQLNAILAPEFALRTSEQPDLPVSKNEMVRRLLTSQKINSLRNRGMAIRAVLGLAVVSFIQSRTATIGGKNRSVDYLVVDLWEANHGKWQIAERFIAPTGLPAELTSHVGSSRVNVKSLP